MGQVLRGGATTTHAVRAAIQRSQASVSGLAERYGLNEKTVRKGRRRATVEDARMGPKEVRSSVPTTEEEAMCVAFRHTLLPLEGCLCALQASVPHLGRSARHRLFQRHDISCLPDREGDTSKRSKFERCPFGDLRIDIAKLRTEEGKLRMFVALDAPSSPSPGLCRRPGRWQRPGPPRGRRGAALPRPHGAHR